MSGIWDDVISEEEKALYRNAGYGRRVGMGRRPAVLMVDLYHTDLRPEGTAEERRFSDPAPEGIAVTLRAIDALLTKARSRRIPIFYSTNQYHEDGRDLGGWRYKSWAAEEHVRLLKGEPYPFLSAVAPGPADWIIYKRCPSVFFGTQLSSHLADLGADTLLIGGQTTSGCVRATVVDAFSHGFRTIVIEECTYDRCATSHKVNLFDMDQKYADVLSLGEVLDYLDRLSAPEVRSTGAWVES
jgi:maleamate amidohydrolase